MITFGIFQRLAKFNGKVWDTIAKLLTRIPGSGLLLQNADPELDRPDSETARTLRRCLSERGVDPERMVLRGPLSCLEHMEIVTQVDIALDSFPYTGQTTTCECLWMGVPVVTLKGTTHVGRVSGGILTRAGHRDWVADSIDSYVEIAASLASDTTGLEGIRSSLRANFIAAGLTDGVTLARELETAYRSFL
jgi:predicted O-linked N-acetylglucosamine transferase (SPINDLY family)